MDGLSGGAARLWPLLAALTPRLAAHARVQVQTFRGRPWYVVTDRDSGAAFRLSGAAEALLGDGAALAGRVAERRPDADDAFREQLALAAVGLYRQGLLDFEPADAVPAELARLRRAEARRPRRNPLAIRIPLGDPDRLLTRLAPHAAGLFTPWAAAALALLAGVFAVLGAMHAEAFRADLLSRLGSSTHWLGFAACYVALKALHELAHALAVKRWGGHVHDVGVMLLVFFPVPYVDASASTAFTDKRRRMIVAAAGILAELAVAALAMLVWVHTEPGAVRAAAFNLVVVGGVSTLLFNGNPLLRFDAYYVLSDLIEIPNLYTRARGYLASRVAAAFGAGAPAPASPGERRWLLAYGLLSTVYRIGVLAAIGLYLGQSFFVVGTLLVSWVVVAEIVLPLKGFLARLRRADQAAGRRLGACARAAGTVAALVAFAAFVPLPQATVVSGVVAVDEDALVRAGASGFLATVHVAPGAAVTPGTRVATLENLHLRRDLAAARAEVVRHEAEYAAAAQQDRVAAQAIAESLAASRRAVEEIAERVAALEVLSPAGGRFAAADLERRHGRWLERGSRLGHVAEPSRLRVRVVVPEARMDLFRATPRHVELRFAAAPGHRVPAQRAGGVPATLAALPSAALGTAGGGSIPVDPADPDGLAPLVNTFRIDLVAAPGGLDGVPVDSRAWARFEHAPEPLLPRAVRAARRLFLAKFST